MLKEIARKIAKALLPILLGEIILVLEEVLQNDINKDGVIGKSNEN